MSDLRMKKLTSIVGFSSLTVLVLALCGCQKAAPRTGPPVIVVGGSIFGQTPGPWLPYSSCSVTDELEWCYGVPNGSENNLYSDQYSPAINNPSVPSGKSWTIHITDKDPQGNGNPKQGVLLCGNAACDENAASDPDKVYIKPYSKTTGHAGWVNSPPNYLFYQDKTCSSHGNCEHPDHAIVSIAGSQVSDSQCVAPDSIGCTIAVGSETLKR